MKIRIFFTLATITLFAFACKKSASLAPVVNNNVNLINKWYITVDSGKQVISGITYPNGYTLYGGGLGIESLLFYSDGTGWDYSYSTSANFNYSISGNVITFNYIGTLPGISGPTT